MGDRDIFAGAGSDIVPRSASIGPLTSYPPGKQDERSARRRERSGNEGEREEDFADAADPATHEVDRLA